MSKGYRFFSKYDSNKESIGIANVTSKKEAIAIFSQNKKLEESEFNKHFSVEKI